MNPIHGHRTRLAILLSLIGAGLPWGQAAHAQGDVDARVANSMSTEVHQSAVRHALGLDRSGVPSMRTNTRAAPIVRRTGAPLRAVASRGEAFVVWDATALGLENRATARNDARSGPATADRERIGTAGERLREDDEHMRAILGLGREPMPADGFAPQKDPLRHPTASRSVAAHLPEQTMVATAGAAPLDVSGVATSDAQNGTPVAAIEAVATVHATQLPDRDAAGVTALLATREPVDAPRQQPEHPPVPAIAEPMQIARRAGPVAPVTLSLPPEDVESLDETLRIRLRGQFRLLERDEIRSASSASRSDVDTDDPMLALLQVLSNRDEEPSRPAPIIFVAGVPEDPRAAVISASVIRHVVDSIARWFSPSPMAPAPTTDTLAAVSAPAEPVVPVAVADAGALSVAPALGPEPVAQIALLQPVAAADVGQHGPHARLLPMNHFDWQGDEAIDLSVPLHDHPLLLRSPVESDTRAEAPHPVVALRPAPAPTPPLARIMNDWVDIFDPSLALATSKHMLIARHEAPAAVAPHRPAIADLVDIFDSDLAVARADRETSVTAGSTVASSASVRSVVRPSSTLRRSALEDAARAATDPASVTSDSPAASSAPVDAPLPAVATQPVATEQALVREIEPQRTAPGVPALVFEADQDRMQTLQGARVALVDAQLDEMRGGFETDNGLKISFGIERAVYINGSLVTSTSLNVADLSKLTAGQVQSVGLDRSSIGIIQSGANNAFSAGQLGSSSVGTVIQNTLNDQRIQGITQINATVNSLDLIRRTNIQQNIQSALTDSIRH